jgi:hypothetical protein
MLMKKPPRFRQRQVPAGAIEQANAKVVLQSADAPAQFRRLHAEAACGRRIAALFDHL